MKKSMRALLLVLLLGFFSTASAQDPITLIIKEAIVRVIKAADLQIQRIQNETIWLQNAQKTVENEMSKLRLEEIARWVEKQRAIYADYFEELKRVKMILTYYHKVKSITDLERTMVRDYRRALSAARKDPNLTSDEVSYISQVFGGILNQSLQGLESLSLVIQSFTTQMSDAARMEIIDGIVETQQGHYDNLQRFSNQNLQLSLSRAKDARDVQLVQALYGIR